MRPVKGDTLTQSVHTLCVQFVLRNLNSYEIAFPMPTNVKSVYWLLPNAFVLCFWSYCSWRLLSNFPLTAIWIIPLITYADTVFNVKVQCGLCVKSYFNNFIVI